MAKGILQTSMVYIHFKSRLQRKRLQSGVPYCFCERRKTPISVRRQRSNPLYAFRTHQSSEREPFAKIHFHGNIRAT
jgi:hypothetical protein